MAKLPIVPLFIALPVVSAVIAYIAYRRSTTVAMLDLRSELRAEQTALRADHAALVIQLEAAKRSLGPPNHASGGVESDGLLPRRIELQSDCEEATQLGCQPPLADSDFTGQSAAGLSDMELEIRLVEILGLSLRVNALAEKYPAARPAAEADRAAPGNQAILHAPLPLIAPT